MQTRIDKPALQSSLRSTSEVERFPSLDFKRVKEELKILQSSLIEDRYKVKLSVSLDGQINLEKESLGEIVAPVKIKISSKKSDPQNIFLYHKTNQRNLYEEERKKAEKDGFFEAIFFNTANQLSEGTITNIFLLKQGCLYTPVCDSKRSCLYRGCVFAG